MNPPIAITRIFDCKASKLCQKPISYGLRIKQWRRVLRCWSTTTHTHLSDTPNSSTKAGTATSTRNSSHAYLPRGNASSWCRHWITSWTRWGQPPARKTDLTNSQLRNEIQDLNDRLRITQNTQKALEQLAARVPHNLPQRDAEVIACRVPSVLVRLY